MAYRKNPRRSGCDDCGQVQRARYSPKHTEQLDAPSQRHSKSIGIEQEVRMRSPRHSRIKEHASRHYYSSDQHDMYRSRSPDEDYISRPTMYQEDYIQPRESHHGYSLTHKFDYAPWKEQSPPSKADHRRSHRFQNQRDEGDEGAEDIMDDHGYVNAQGSDVEDIPFSQADYQQDTSPSEINSEADERSDVVSVKGKFVGSDVVSIGSRRSSCSLFDQRSIMSLEVGSDVHDRPGSNDSESDDEDGYILLDEYIAVASDCASFSADEDTAYGSDIADASDVEIFDEGEDCIGDQNGNKGRNEVRRR